MNKETQIAKIQELAVSITPDIKTRQDLANLTSELVKHTVGMALGGELDAHPGYPKHSPFGHNTRRDDDTGYPCCNSGDVWG